MTLPSFVSLDPQLGMDKSLFVNDNTTGALSLKKQSAWMWWRDGTAPQNPTGTVRFLVWWWELKHFPLRISCVYCMCLCLCLQMETSMFRQCCDHTLGTTRVHLHSSHNSLMKKASHYSQTYGPHTTDNIKPLIMRSVVQYCVYLIWIHVSCIWISSES